jgi:hypothetical protein
MSFGGDNSTQLKSAANVYHYAHGLDQVNRVFTNDNQYSIELLLENSKVVSCKNLCDQELTGIFYDVRLNILYIKL